MTTLDTDTITAYEHRITAAYRRLAHPGDWVSLTDLRPEVGGRREHVDAALRNLSRTQRANLVVQANRKVLTHADRDAAVRIGLDDCHLISIA